MKPEDRQRWQDRTKWIGAFLVGVTALALLYLALGPVKVTWFKVGIPGVLHVLGWAAVSERVVDQGIEALEAVRGGGGG